MHRTILKKQKFTREKKKRANPHQ